MADEFDGHGGSYVVENGVRRKVHGTDYEAPGDQAESPEPEKKQELEVGDVSSHT